ncbi:nucleoside triphosphate pyrophosphatase [Niveibacterium sp.]|uniref:Maf family protein n=1 Tax=Niveibacterium sp. TaxID=2017444 RepID=UPI0035B341A1
MRTIVLASTSRYRRELLARLELPFVTDKPDTDETPLAGEAPVETAIRLAEAKARAVAARHPDALIIGSDQVASVGDERFGKPGTVERAIAQLKQMSGRSIVFHTAVSLLDTNTGHASTLCVPTEVGFRHISDAEIERYVSREMPLDCAGSAKSEALGITLLDHIRGDDPNALVGLPMIALCRLLRDAGIQTI